MLIPPERLTEDTLQSLIEEFITREGTDYGFEEMSLEQKVQQVAHQIRSGEVVIIFDGIGESVNLMTRDDYQQWVSDVS